jgi:hypothetical protein
VDLKEGNNNKKARKRALCREEALWIAAALLVVGALVVLVDGEGGKRVLNGAMTQARVLDIHR